MHEQVAKIVSSCITCQKNKITNKKKLGELSQLGPAKNPFEIVSLDTIGGLSGYNSKKKYLHLAIDHFTRYAWGVCSKGQSAIDFINLIKTIQKFETPKLILADKYTGIRSKCAQSNGMIERLNQTLMTRMRCKINQANNKACWPKLFESVLGEYINYPHTSTEFPPNYLLFGLQPFIPPLPLDNYPPLEVARKLSLENTKMAHERNKKTYDKQHVPYTFHEGDLVMVERGSKINRRKLDNLRNGLYKILEKKSGVIYLIDLGNNKRDLFHISKLFP